MEKDKKALPKKDTKLKAEKSVKSVAVDVPAKDVVMPAKIKAGLKVPSVSFYGTGKRKTSIAKVWLFPGSGVIEIIRNSV